MANKKADSTTEPGTVSEAAAATRAAIGERPRQSAVRFVELYNIVAEVAPDRIDELFGSQAEVVANHASEAKNPVTEAIAKVSESQLELAVKALTNTDAQNGYANYVFDEAVFAEKTRVKAPRTKKSVVDKVTELTSEASNEQLEALAEILRARGITV